MHGAEQISIMSSLHVPQYNILIYTVVLAGQIYMHFAAIHTSTFSKLQRMCGHVQLARTNRRQSARPRPCTLWHPPTSCSPRSRQALCVIALSLRCQPFVRTFLFVYRQTPRTWRTCSCCLWTLTTLMPASWRASTLRTSTDGN